MITKAQERQAQKLVRASIDKALAEMRDYVQRGLLAGRDPDRRMMVEFTRGLSDIADEYALDLTAGKWGDMIADAMKDAAHEVAVVAAEAGVPAGAMLTVGKREVEAALYKGYDGIKGILAGGERVVAEEMLQSIVGGKSQREVAASLRERLQVADDAGELGEIPGWRADLIARNELIVNYRTTGMAAAEEAGFKQYEMRGPDDDRTDGDVCSAYLGQVHTVEEWEEIAAEEGVDSAYPLLQYGFHPNCRHQWIPVAESLDLTADAEAAA